MPATSYPKAIGGVCQSTTNYPVCRCWTVKCSDSMATNCIWPYKGHAQLSTRQASPQCIWPVRALGSQTRYPRNHQPRQAIPEFSKGGTLNIRGGRERGQSRKTAQRRGNARSKEQSDSRLPTLPGAIVQA